MSKFFTILLMITPIMSIISVGVSEVLGVSEWSFIKKKYTPLDMLTVFKTNLLRYTLDKKQWTRVSPVKYAEDSQDYFNYEHTQEYLLFYYDMKYSESLF